MSSGPYVIDENGNKSDAAIWAGEMSAEEEKDFDDYVRLRSLEIAIRKKKEKRADLRNENKTDKNNQPTE